MKKILILTAPFGSGHLQAAKALAKEFNNYQDIIVDEYDFYSNKLPIRAKLIQKAYLNCYKPIGKNIYKTMFYRSDKAVFSPLRKMGKKQLHNKIASFKPDAIILTYPVTSLYYLKDFEHIPTFTVITDYYANKLWFYKNTIRHYVANKNIANYGIDHGFTKNRFKITGIPILEEFYQKIDKTPLYDKFGLKKEKDVILIAAGSYGVLPNAYELTKELSKTYKNLQIVVACGNNNALLTKLQNLDKTYDNIIPLSYCNKMYELLSLCQLIITKPGGLTLTEAAVKAVPVVMYNPMYGQEYENALFFAKKDAGLLVTNKQELTNAVANLLNNKHILNKTKKNIEKLALCYSAQIIVKDIMNYFKTI